MIALRTYRRHRLEVRDDGGDGWTVTVYAPDCGQRTLLRSTVPYGLSRLIAEAEECINRSFEAAGLEAGS